MENKTIQGIHYCLSNPDEIDMDMDEVLGFGVNDANKTRIVLDNVSAWKECLHPDFPTVVFIDFDAIRINTPIEIFDEIMLEHKRSKDIFSNHS